MMRRDVWVEVAGGVRLRVRHWPGASAESDGSPGPARAPFLLVHGLSSNARLWDEVATALAGHPVYAVDLRSHGESDAPPDGYDTATAAADLAVVCDRLGLAPAVVAGQSWGGNVVARLAAEHPALVTALALVDGGWIDLSTRFSTWEECEEALRPPDVDGMLADDIRGFFRREHSDWSDTAVEASLANLHVGPDGHVRRRLSVSRHVRILRSMWDDPPWQDFPRISVPVLLIPAVPDDPAAAESGRAVVAKAEAALARATVREYVGADHDIHAQHPRALALDLLTLAGSR